jgi:hypothetical protein
LGPEAEVDSFGDCFFVGCCSGSIVGCDFVVCEKISGKASGQNKYERYAWGQVDATLMLGNDNEKGGQCGKNSGGGNTHGKSFFRRF